MKAIMVMFDSLCRRMLSPYGATDVDTPGFQCLAEHSLRFDWPFYRQVEESPDSIEHCKYHFGKEMNITDGRYIHMRGSKHDQQVYEYTLMPCYMNYRMSPELLATATFVPPTKSFPFAKNGPLLKTRSVRKGWKRIFCLIYRKTITKSILGKARRPRRDWRNK